MQALSKKSVENKVIDESSENQRIDNYLINYLKGVPKSHIYRIIRNGEVRINSKRVSQTYRLQLHDQLRIPPISKSEKSDKKQYIAKGSSINKLIIFEDDYFIAINKPTGLAVHGGSGISLGVIEQLRQERPQHSFLELVHRLDRDTSGLLLIAKKRSFLTKMHELIRDGQVVKYYQTFVKGITKNHHTIRLSLLKTQNNQGDRQVRVSQEGQQATTITSTIQHYEEGSLLKVHLITGRTHQIRVHLSHIQHPLAGDNKYGDFAWNRELQQRFHLKRLFLHASTLQFKHPILGLDMKLNAPVPKELSDFISQLHPIT